MRQLGDKHAAPDGPPLRLIHKECGEISEPHLVCCACGEPIGARDVKAIRGPGDVEELVHTASTGALTGGVVQQFQRRLDSRREELIGQVAVAQRPRELQGADHQSEERERVDSSSLGVRRV
jgi:hypothetical protein